MSGETVDLDAAGRRLFDDLAEESDSYSLTVLIVEAARTKDRLDKLDLLLRGDIDTWAVLVHDLRTEDYELKINSAAAEARQLASVLRQLLSEIRRQKGDAGGSDDDDDLDGL
ncbi:hypothetical protein ACTHQY_08985 [Rhodococcoides corynebacterioides]|uniref:hypothetical protein n=1 Tax=Rhodococcoides corynebacterioides TaxID=53972 RepID=UPI003F81BFD1